MKKNARLFVIVSLIFLFIFVLFSLFVHKNIFINIDINTTVKLQNITPRYLDLPFSMLSLIGSFEIATLLLLIILVIFRRLKSFFVLLFFALIHIPEFLGKTFVDHPGPASSFFRYDINFLFPSSYVQPGSSYPSGHSARTIFISIILGFLISKTKLSKNQKWFLYFSIIIFDFIMFLSRIYLGEHWVSDVIGGSLLGLSFGLFSLAFL